MSFTQVIEAQTIEELKSKVLDLNAALNCPQAKDCATQVAPTPCPAPPPVNENQVEPVAPVAPKNKGGRPKKTAEEEIMANLPGESVHAEEEKEFDPFADEVAAKEITADDVKAALMKVKTTVSMKHCTDIFKSVGAETLSQIKTEDYAKVLAACEKLLVK